MPPITRFLIVCAFFCHCNSVSALPYPEGVGVAVLFHLSHRQIPLQTLEPWRVAGDHVPVHIPHGPKPFSTSHSGCASTHWLCFASCQTQRQGFLVGDTL